MAENSHHADRHASTVSLLVPGWAGRFIDIPYQEHGHGFDGASCWGLVHLVLAHRGIDVPHYGEVSAADANAVFAGQASTGPWREVDDPQPFDVALMRDVPLHTGILIAPGLLLHVWRAPSSMAMALDNPRIRARILGFYRHSALA